MGQIDLVQKVVWDLERVSGLVCGLCHQVEGDEFKIHLDIYYLDLQGKVRVSSWDLICCQWCFSQKMNLQEKIENLYA